LYERMGRTLDGAALVRRYASLAAVDWSSVWSGFIRTFGFEQFLSNSRARETKGDFISSYRKPRHSIYFVLRTVVFCREGLPILDSYSTLCQCYDRSPEAQGTHEPSEKKTRFIRTATCRRDSRNALPHFPKQETHSPMGSDEVGKTCPLCDRASSGRSGVRKDT
jgi:hypothetical protein